MGTSMRIGDIASGRAGDKGDVLDLTLVAYTERDYDVICSALTAEEAGKALHRAVPGDVVRYELPNLLALKFVAPSALPGGVHASLRAGLHWQKAAIWLLLDYELADAHG